MVQHHLSKEMRMKARAKAIKNKVLESPRARRDVISPQGRFAMEVDSSTIRNSPTKLASPKLAKSPSPKQSSKGITKVWFGHRKSKSQLKKDAEDEILLPAREDSDAEELEGEDESTGSDTDFEYDDPRTRYEKGIAEEVFNEVNTYIKEWEQKGLIKLEDTGE